MIRKDTVYLVLTAMFFTLLAISNLISTTAYITIFELSLSQSLLTAAPSFLVSEGKYLLSIPVGIILYSATFLIIDIISEFYGKLKTIKVVLAGFVMNFFLLLAMMIADSLVGSSGEILFSGIFETMRTNIIAISVAFLISQVLNVNLYHWLMKKTKGKHLWLRNNVSTIISQLVGSIIVVSIVYLAGDLSDQVTSAAAAIFLIANIFAFKCLFALCDTPVLYAAVMFLKAKMTKFQPFRHNNNRRRNNNNNNRNNNSRRSHNNSRKDSLPFTD